MAKGKGKDKGKDPKKEIYSARSLPVKLSAEEVRGFAEEAANMDAEITAIEAAKKAALDGFKSELSHAKSKRSEALRAVREGTEDKTLRCTTRLDFADGFAITVRDDSGEEIDRRPLNQEERQMDLEDLSLFFDEPFMEWVQRTLKVMPRASMSFVCRKFDLDIDSATELLEICEKREWVGPPKDGGEARDVLIFDPAAAEDAAELEPPEDDGEEEAAE